MPPRRPMGGMRGSGMPVPAPEGWFLVKVTAVLAGPSYTAEEWWLTASGALAAKSGGIRIASSNPGYCLNGALLAGDYALARSAPGAAGTLFELVALITSAGGGAPSLGGGSVTGSQSNLSGAAVSISALNTWTNTGLTLALPSAGTYFVYGRVTGYLSLSAIGTSIIPLLARIYDVTGAAAVSRSTAIATAAGQASITFAGTAPLSSLITVTVPTTLRVEAQVYDAAGSGTAISAAAIYNGPDSGETVLGYLKLS